MNALEFVNKVRDMRAAQKAYFKKRLQGDLITSKQMEAEVDKALKEGVTLYATATLESMDGEPAEGIQQGDFMDDLLDTPEE